MECRFQNAVECGVDLVVRDEDVDAVMPLAAALEMEAGVDSDARSQRVVAEKVREAELEASSVEVKDMEKGPRETCDG